MFEWKSDYSVGISSIDAQHQGLFRCAAELHDAMAAGRGKAVMGQLLDRLVQYTKAHFAHEERLLREHGYPEFAGHLAQHEELRQRVLRYQEDFHKGHVNISVQMLRFLQDWLEQHIKGSDRKYVPHLKDRAGSTPALTGSRQ